MPSTYQSLQHLLYSRQRVGVLFCASIQAAKVNTKLQAAILFPHQHHCIEPSTLVGPDGTRLQHFLQVVPNLFNQQWGNASKSFLKGSVICNFYHMFRGMGKAQFCCIQWEHIMVFSQELADSILQLRAQESRPLKSNSLNNIPCLCLMVSLGEWGSWDLSAPSSNCSSSGGLGTGNAATALAMRVFFQRVCEYAVLFLTTTTAFLLPCLNSVYMFCTVRPCG